MMQEENFDETTMENLFSMIALGQKIKINKKFLGILMQTDRRSQKDDPMVIKGFAAIHYAIYFKNQFAVDFILKQKQFTLKISSAFPMPFNRYPESKKLTLDSGSDALSLAIACNNIPAVQLLLITYKKNKIGFGNRSTNTQGTAFLLSLLVDNDASRISLKDQDFVEQQIGLLDEENTSNFHQLFALKRLGLFKLLSETYIQPKNAPMRRLFYENFLKLNSYGEGARHMLDDEIDFLKMGSSDAEQRELIFQHDELMERVHEFCEKYEDTELQEMLDEYRTAISQRKVQQKQLKNAISRNNSQTFQTSKLRISRSQQDFEDTSSHT